MHAMEWILLEEKKLQEKSGNKGLRIQHTQSDNGEKKVPYRDKKSRQHITTWMVTLWINVVMNMPMNLMGAGIMVAHAVSLEKGRHYMFKEKISSNVK